MLELLSELTQEWAAQYDLATFNFVLSWIGAMGATLLMAMVAPHKGWHTFEGKIAWARSCGLFWLTVALVLGGSYPVQENAQPWLPTLLLTGAITLLIGISLAVEMSSRGQTLTGKPAQ